MKPIRCALYHLIVWVPILLSGRANILDGIRDSWPAVDWLFAAIPDAAVLRPAARQTPHCRHRDGQPTPAITMEV